MRILLASGEVHPYSKTGGLADSVGAFAKALARAGHQVAVVTPLYRGVRDRFPAMKPVDWRFDQPLGSKLENAGLLALDPAERLRVYFINHPGYYDRAGVYGERGSDYWDNGERFVFFSKCVTHLARYLPEKPDVLHVHDWHTGLVPLLVSHLKRAGEWADAPTVCLTIHNLAYQGVFPRSAFALTNLPLCCFGAEGAEFHGQMNCLKAGIATADVITTVSPRYAREITTVELGAGLDGWLRRRQSALVGILNGVDYDEWNTNRNPLLPASYSATDLSGKAACKAALQCELNLPIRPDCPLFGMVTRLAEQKGIEILLGALKEMLSANLQFVLLGTGDPAYESAFMKLASQHPEKVAVRISYDHPLAHRIEAGCDFHLMPSRFEPCGLNQMYSLRYGTIPIVRRTGGLDDTVVDIGENLLLADGIKFTEYAASALAKAIRKALVLATDPVLLSRYRRNAMRAKFDWSTAVREYIKAFTTANARMLNSTV